MQQPSDPLLPMLDSLTDEGAACFESQRRQRGQARWRRQIIRGGLFVFLIIGAYFAYNRMMQLPFDSSQWKAVAASTSSAEKVNIRGRMYRDLLKSGRLIGLDHFQVISLLGKPAQYGIREWDMGYTVGLDTIDPVMLVIKFDQNKRVSDCDIFYID